VIPYYGVVFDQRIEGDLSVVIPAFNTWRALSELLNALNRKIIQSGLSADLIVVDDGSFDESTSDLPRLSRLSLLRGSNQGKGAAVLTGMMFSKGRVCAFVDGDGAYDEDALFAVCDPVLSGDAKLSVGHRVVPPGTFLRARLSNVFSYLVKRWYELDFDTQAGVKAFHRDVIDGVLPNLTAKGFSFDVKLLASARELGYWPAAIVDVRPRSTETTSVNARRSFDALLDLYHNRIS